MKKPKAAKIDLRVPADLKARLEAAAERQGRTLSDLCLRVLSGLEPPPRR